MSEDKFVLSEKINDLKRDRTPIDSEDYRQFSLGWDSALDTITEDVREFIKKLKDRIKAEKCMVFGGTEDDNKIIYDSLEIAKNNFIEEIDKLSGDLGK